MCVCRGKKVELSGESYDACLQSCRDSPELKDSNQSGVFGVADAALGGEKANQDGKQHHVSKKTIQAI